MPARLRLHAATAPARVALRSDDLALDYGQLVRAIDALAAELHALPAGAIALQADNGIDWALLDLAALVARRALVPLPPFFSAGQREHALASAGVSVELRPREQEIARAVVAAGDLRAALAACTHDVRTARGDLGDKVALPAGTAKVTFTSGTTGRPKGVCLAATTMAEVTASVAAAVGPLGVQRHLCVLPLSTLLENLAGLHAALWHGVECVLPPLSALGLQGSSGIDVMTFIGRVAQSGADSLILVPQLLLALTVAAERGVPFGGWKFIAVGGARTSPALLARAHAQGLPVYEGYGLSECASVCCLNLPGASRAGTVGRPLGNVRIEVTPTREVRVHGRAMLGYVGGDGTHRHDFHDAMTRDGWGTGDLGEFDDAGFLRIDGRSRDVFITAFGRNVSPEWVEGELAAELPIAHALVHGEARPDVVAVLVPRGDVDDAALAAAVASTNARLPDYARIARWVRAPATDTQPDLAALFTENGRLRRDRATARWQPLIDALHAPTCPPTQGTQAPAS